MDPSEESFAQKRSRVSVINSSLTTTDKFLDSVRNFDLKMQPVNPAFIKSSDSKYENSRKVSLSNFVQVCFDFAFLLLACPFRISPDNRGNLIIKKWKVQQFLCACMQVMCLIRLMTEVRVSIQKEYRCKSVTKNPVQYFNIIMDIASFIYKCVTMKRLWFNQDDYLRVVNFADCDPHFHPNPRNSVAQVLQNVIFLRCFFGAVTLHVLASFFCGKFFVDESSSWTLSFWTNQLVKLARFTFFVDDKFKKSDRSILPVISSLDGFLAFMMAICMIQRYIHGLFCDLLILSCTMTLRTAAKSFATTLFDATINARPKTADNWNNYSRSVLGHTDMLVPGRLTWDHVYHHFRQIQKLSMIVNRALGNQVTWYMTEGIMYYSVFLNLVLTSRDVFVRIDLSIFYFTTISILIISADICNQMEMVKVWIAHGENRKTVAADEFSIVLHEMIAKDVGIRGSNVFTITYSLLAMFFSTIVTYFIICIQQSGDSNSALNNATQCDI